MNDFTGRKERLCEGADRSPWPAPAARAMQRFPRGLARRHWPTAEFGVRRGREERPSRVAKFAARPRIRGNAMETFLRSCNNYPKFTDRDLFDRARCLCFDIVGIFGQIIANHVHRGFPSVQRGSFRRRVRNIMSLRFIRTDSAKVKSRDVLNAASGMADYNMFHQEFAEIHVANTFLTTVNIAGVINRVCLA